MNLQDMLEQQDVERPFRMLLYGVAGIGKSTFAAHAPQPIFVQTEDGLIDIDAPRTKLCRSFAQFMAYLTALREAKDQYKTIVIDSLDWLEELMTVDVLQTNAEAKQKGYTKLADFPYGKGGMELKPRAVAVLNALKALYYDGFNILLIAHTKPEKVVNPDGTDYDQHSPRLNKNINPIFKEWVDIIGFCNFDFRVEEETDVLHKTVKAVARTDNNKTALRRIWLTGTPAVVAKCRYRNLPDWMPLNGKLFFETLANRGVQTNDAQ